jgi:hypothetical protein
MANFVRKDYFRAVTGTCISIFELLKSSVPKSQKDMSSDDSARTQRDDFVKKYYFQATHYGWVSTF